MNAKNKVIATDLDGTLFYPKKRIRMISSSNKIFLRKFIDEGGRVLLVSGRNYDYLKLVRNRLKRNVDLSGCNGSFVFVNDKFIKQSFINNKRLMNLLEDAKKRYKFSGLLLMSKEHNLVVPRQEFGLINRLGFLIYQLDQGVYKEKAIKNDEVIKHCLKSDHIYKIMFFFGPSKKKKEYCYKCMLDMMKRYKDFAFAYNGPSIEMTNITDTKASAIKVYLDYLKINHHNVMVVGDSGNDISMFQTFENSFCMANASKETKKEAKHVIRRVSDLEKYL